MNIYMAQHIAHSQAMRAHLVETGNNVAEVNPRGSCIGHLVEEVISKQLQQVAVSRL